MQGKATSQEFKIKSGVPQGSVVGPLLFLAYVDQIFEVKLSASARLIMFADELVYVKPIPSPKEQTELEQDIEFLSEKYRNTELELNFMKCKCMLMNSSTKNYELPILLNNEAIDQTRHVCTSLSNTILNFNSKK
jgi:ribonucleases P/MRP protein subunit RPP40